MRSTTTSRLSQQLQAIRGQVAARKGSFKIKPDTSIVDPEFHVRAHEVIFESLNASTIKTEKIDPKALFLQQKADPRAFDRELRRLSERVGADVIVVGDKIFWLEAQGELRRRAAEMVIDRVNPLPNRVDSARRTRFKILRIDPNKKEATLEELPPEAALPALDEPL